MTTPCSSRPIWPSHSFANYPAVRHGNAGCAFLPKALCAMALLLVTFLTALPEKTFAAKGYDNDTLVYAWSSNVGPLNPHGYGANMMFAQALVYEPLVLYGEGGAILPCLAEKWDISPDGKTYTFTLRQGVAFTDGTPFNAEAVKENFDAIMKNIKRHNWLETAALIDSYKVTGPYTFQMVLKQPYAATLQELSLVRPFRFMSPAAMGDGGDTSGRIKAPVGTGPWKHSETKKGEFDSFTRNDTYWGAKPAMKNLVIKVIPDAETRAVALETNEIDLIATAIADHGSAGVNPDAFAALSKDSAYETKLSAPRNTRLLAINSRLEPTNDRAVRQAIVQAVNRPAIIKAILLDQELPAEELLARDIPFCDVPLKPYAYDPKAAAALLENDGWVLRNGDSFRTKNGKELTLDIKFIANEAIMRSIAEAIQSELAAIGINARPVGEEPNAFGSSQTNGDFNMIFCESNGAPYDPFSYIAAMRIAGHADFQAQRGLPDKAKLDAMITKALGTTDTKELGALFTSILTLLHDEVVYLPLSRTIDKAIYKKGTLEGFVFSPVSYELPFARVKRQ